jgi:hypothetical protein
MEFSTPHQRNKYWPVPEDQFKYQVDIDKDKFDNVSKKKGEKLDAVPLSTVKLRVHQLYQGSIQQR